MRQEADTKRKQDEEERKTRTQQAADQATECKKEMEVNTRRDAMDIKLAAALDKLNATVLVQAT